MITRTPTNRRSGGGRDTRSVIAISPIHERAIIDRSGVRLSAVLLLPGREGPYPCVVFVHGLGSGKDSVRNVVIAERMVNAGIGALLFDLSGHGESSEDPRGQNQDAYMDDTAAVIGWVNTRPEIDRRFIGLAGSSLGAVIALGTVREQRAALSAMVLRAPPLHPGDLDVIDTQVLVIVGSEDPLLPLIRAETQSIGVNLEVVPGAGHLFEEPGTLEQAAEATVAWFIRHLKSEDTREVSDGHP